MNPPKKQADKNSRTLYKYKIKISTWKGNYPNYEFSHQPQWQKMHIHAREICADVFPEAMTLFPELQTPGYYLYDKQGTLYTTAQICSKKKCLEFITDQNIYGKLLFNLDLQPEVIVFAESELVSTIHWPILPDKTTMRSFKATTIDKIVACKSKWTFGLARHHIMDAQYMRFETEQDKMDGNMVGHGLEMMAHKSLPADGSFYSHIYWIPLIQILEKLSCIGPNMEVKIREGRDRKEDFEKIENALTGLVVKLKDNINHCFPGKKFEIMGIGPNADEVSFQHGNQFITVANYVSNVLNVPLEYPSLFTVILKGLTDWTMLVPIELLLTLPAIVNKPVPVPIELPASSAQRKRKQFVIPKKFPKWAICFESREKPHYADEFVQRLMTIARQCGMSAPQPLILLGSADNIRKIFEIGHSQEIKFIIFVFETRMNFLKGTLPIHGFDYNVQTQTILAKNAQGLKQKVAHHFLMKTNLKLGGLNRFTVSAEYSEDKLLIGIEVTRPLNDKIMIGYSSNFTDHNQKFNGDFFRRDAGDEGMIVKEVLERILADGKFSNRSYPAEVWIYITGITEFEEAGFLQKKHVANISWAKPNLLKNCNIVVLGVSDLIEEQTKKFLPVYDTRNTFWKTVSFEENTIKTQFEVISTTLPMNIKKIKNLTFRLCNEQQIYKKPKVVPTPMFVARKSCSYGSLLSKSKIVIPQKNKQIIPSHCNLFTLKQIKSIQML